MFRFSTMGLSLALATGLLSLSQLPLLSTASEEDHVNPFIAVKLATTLPKPLSDLTVTRVYDLVYIVGGCDATDGNKYNSDAGEFTCDSISGKLYRFDPLTEEFVTLTDMPTARYRHASVAVRTANTWIMVLGGRDLNDDIITDVDIYNIEEDTWTTFTDLPKTYWTSDHTGFGDVNDQSSDAAYGYFAGGFSSDYNAKSTFFRINVAETFTQNDLAIEDLQEMTFARGDVASIFNDAGKFAIVAGGFSHENNFCEPLASVEKYDIKTDQWKLLDDLIKPRSDKVLVELDEDHVFAIGGERQIVNICNLTEGDTPEPGEATIPVDDVEILHLDLGDWEQLADLEFNRFRFAAASYPENNKFYTFGGQLSYNDTCKCFDTTDEIVVYTGRLTGGSSATSTTSLSVMLVTAITVSVASFVLI